MLHVNVFLSMTFDPFSADGVTKTKTKSKAGARMNATFQTESTDSVLGDLQWQTVYSATFYSDGDNINSLLYLLCICFVCVADGLGW